LEEEMLAEDFWEDRERAQEVMQRLSKEKGKLEAVKNLEQQAQDLEVLYSLSLEEEEAGLEKEIRQGLTVLEEQLERLELETLLAGPYDRNNAIISLHAGAGGTESQDWTQMLFRMYTRFAEKEGFQVQILDLLPGDEAGIKSATLLVRGENAYGYLKAEKGVHRLVRISPFDASGRRHTSFASVECLPEVSKEMEVEIDPADLKVDTYRAGGAGGQHVNKTDSAVRITHLPTGIVVQCQNERSQHSNRLTAMKILQAKLLELEQQKKEEELARLRGEQRKIAWGSQIRSYVFHPYCLVKDHRINKEIGDVNGVMDGDIMPFIEDYLKQQARGKI
jgi:peptide chain release factor 2